MLFGSRSPYSEAVKWRVDDALIIDRMGVRDHRPRAHPWRTRPLVVGEALEFVIVLAVVLANLAALVAIQKWSGLT